MNQFICEPASSFSSVSQTCKTQARFRNKIYNVEEDFDDGYYRVLIGKGSAIKQSHANDDYEIS